MVRFAPLSTVHVAAWVSRFRVGAECASPDAERPAFGAGLSLIRVCRTALRGGSRLAFRGVDVEWAGPPFDHFGVDCDFLDATQVGQLEHGVEQDAFHDGAEAT